MKMADDSLMTFQNNCESINRNGVEVAFNRSKDGGDGADAASPAAVNKQDDQLQNGMLQNSSDVPSRDDVVDEFLAGENKPEFDSELLLATIDNDGEGISFKSENTLAGCNNEEIDVKFAVMGEMENSASGARCTRVSPAGFVAKTLKRRSIRCLNKMQIMEDVREGCNVQPSSPGHAELRTDGDATIKTESNAENGYPEPTSNEENDDNGDIAKEDAKSSEVDIEEPIKPEFSDPSALADENFSNASSQSGESTKRKSESEDFPTKRLRTDIQEHFSSRDKILNEFMEMAGCNNLDQIHTFSEQLLAEIKTLNELAKEKEREWNNIIHLKKIKEELLLRMQRKKQVMMIDERAEYLDDTENEQKGALSHSILKSNLTNPPKGSSLRIPSVSLNGEKSKSRPLLPKFPLDFNGSLDLRQAKQRPTLDVQSIIADYRQRHPETVPRRGRRIRNLQSDGAKSNSVLSFASMALGSGSQVRQNLQGVDMTSELGMLLSSMNGNRVDGSKSSLSESVQDNTSFRDMLLQFAKLSQSERNELIQNAIKPPPPYPEVTVHPVPTTTAPPTNSLLHGILTKSTPKQTTKTSFSPTLARLLTAPERAAVSHATSTPTMTNNSTTIHPANMSISEILSTSKARNEITITPVGSQYETTPLKTRTTEEEEAEDSADRLVIDEGGEGGEARKIVDNSSDAGDEVPPCQGCNQKPAQFVCAGCGNQWYCSRDCQVSAWDEHSEVCSG